MIAMMLCACQAADLQSGPADREQVALGREAAERLGCGACHILPGIDWPQGKVGPDLHGFADRAMIAGQLPNKPEILTRFVRDAPSLTPGTAMPAVPMEDGEARAIAAWLRSLHAS